MSKTALRCLFPLPVVPCLVLTISMAGWATAGTGSRSRAPAAPVLLPPPGTYQTGVEVSISCPVPGTRIYYTTDGSAPGMASLLYSGVPVPVSNHVSAPHDPDPMDENVPLTSVSLTIRTIAISEEGEASSESGGDYRIDKVESWFNIAYAPPPVEGGGKHLLDIYHPRGKTGNKVVLFIHGGAWKQGDKNIYLELGNTLAGYYGFTTVTASYELSADPWHAIHPGHVEDVAAAAAWVVENIAGYGGDPEKLFIFGQSAGGHLVSLLATDGSYLARHGLTPSILRAVISMSGVYDVHDLVQFPLNPLGLSAVDVLGYKTLCQNTFGSWDQSVLDAASPASSVNPEQPPFFLIHAWEDLPGFSQEAIDFHQQIQNVPGLSVQIYQLLEKEIPPEVLSLDLGGHYEEIYAINTRNWNSVSSRLIADYINSPLHYRFDVNRDGLLNEVDYEQLSRILAEMDNAAAGTSLRGDVNLDSRTDLMDLILLRLELEQ